jgi:hypothetical protein
MNKSENWKKKIREQQKTFNLRVKLKRKITLTKRKKI